MERAHFPYHFHAFLHDSVAAPSILLDTMRSLVDVDAGSAIAVGIDICISNDLILPEDLLRTLTSYSEGSSSLADDVKDLIKHQNLLRTAA